MTKQEQIKAFFGREVVRECVSVKRVAEMAGVCYNTLHPFLKGVKGRNLSDEQINKIIPVIKELGFGKSS